ncbi:NAD(P)H-dependent oxidoreductase [Mycobacterium paragordonae]|uniref:NAD(P)H-dependent oxidoreductase n=1 Tax=Mycobacterium paragordonae TaxID=1389713 RepID=UPI0007EC9D3D|nr:MULTISPECIES: NADPH-dependent FMN reductase [Mycobacterium]OBJ90209.1 FMN reductase [Mycobacterium gordonae]TDL01892.1 NAD(P)H-dependent oxidoreductase [Mycobacterium paragordonae]
MEINNRRERTVTGIKILALVGSLRAGSVNRQIAELAAELAPEGVTVAVFEGLGEVPFYNEDIDDAMNSELDQAPAQAAALRAAAAEADAALVVTPEYNGSLPAVVKNAIDWLSRPFGNGALKDKPLAVIGGSAGQYGGVWAHDETRKSFGIAGARVSDAIKLSVPFATLGGSAPSDNEELAANLRDVVGKLVAEVG